MQAQFSYILKSKYIQILPFEVSTKMLPPLVKPVAILVSELSMHTHSHIVIEKQSLFTQLSSYGFVSYQISFNRYIEIS